MLPTASTPVDRKTGPVNWNDTFKLYSICYQGSPLLIVVNILQYLNMCFSFFFPWCKYSSLTFRVGQSGSIFHCRKKEERSGNLKSHVKMSWSVVPHPIPRPLFKAIHFFLLSPLLWEEGAALHCLSSVSKTVTITCHVVSIYFWYVTTCTRREQTHNLKALVLKILIHIQITLEMFVSGKIGL